MDTDEVVAVAGQASRRSAGRPDERAITDLVAARGGERVRLGIDLFDPCAEDERHVLRRPEIGLADQDTVEALVLGQIFLAQRRTLVRRVGLVADQSDRASKPVLPQRDRRLRPAVPGADDGHVEVIRGERQRWPSGKRDAAYNDRMPTVSTAMQVTSDID